MYEIKDLFDIRSVVGTKIEQAMIEKGFTKTELSNHTGVSRPTIGKLLTGTLTNKSNYEKHITKVLKCLELTPDMLFDNGKTQNNRVRLIRNMKGLSSDEMSDLTGISLERLNQIESGEEATIAELRDIALSLSISVNTLLGKNYFAPQIADMDYFVRFNENKNLDNFSGFWGHIGILLKGMTNYLWYPISSNTRTTVYNMIKNERVVIPCMDNKLLYLYMPNVKEIILLDDACDQPESVNWNSNVSCGEIPLVVYEALEDYIIMDAGDVMKDVLSEKIQKYLDAFIKKYEWKEEEIYEKLYYSAIYYNDGSMRSVDIEFEYEEENILEEIAKVYDFEDSEYSNNIFYFSATEGSEVIVNIKNVSMMEFPFLKVENAIVKMWEEVIKENGI